MLWCRYCGVGANTSARLPCVSQLALLLPQPMGADEWCSRGKLLSVELYLLERCCFILVEYSYRVPSPENRCPYDHGLPRASWATAWAPIPCSSLSRSISDNFSNLGQNKWFGKVVVGHKHIISDRRSHISLRIPIETYETNAFRVWLRGVFNIQTYPFRCTNSNNNSHKDIIAS